MIPLTQQFLDLGIYNIVEFLNYIKQLFIKDKMITTYSISKNGHYSSIWPVPHNGITTMTGKVLFDPSCKYTLTDPECINDINKVYGFGYGLGLESHLQWSIRLGWRVHSNGLVELFNFSHINGKQTAKRIGRSTTFFNYNQWYDFELKNDTLNKMSSVKVDIFTATESFDKTPQSGYILKPYFGGQCSNPNLSKMIIKIDI